MAGGLRGKPHFAPQMKERALVLVFFAGVPVSYAARLLGCAPRSVYRWWREFARQGSVERAASVHAARWPAEAVERLKEEIEINPSLYIEEIIELIIANFPDVRNVSQSTVLRVLHNDLHYSCKTLQTRAVEARTLDIQAYFAELGSIYKYPEQLLFIDEVSKDGRGVFRRKGWSAIGSRAYASVEYGRGKRQSVVAALNVHGFVAWEAVEGTFTRGAFHRVFCEKVLPVVRPNGGPNSIIILDNASIHRYKALYDAAAAVGGTVVFLPPYCPQLNPIEYAFNQMRMWMQKHCTFRNWQIAPDEILNKAFETCASYDTIGLKMYAKCGYEVNGVLARLLPAKMKPRVCTTFPFIRTPIVRVVVPYSNDEDAYTEVNTSESEDLDEEVVYGR